MPSAQGHITIRRRPKDGTDGSDAVRYWLQPSDTVVRLSKTKTLSPPSVSCRVMTQTGDREAAETSALYVRCKTTDTMMVTRWRTYTPGIALSMNLRTLSVMFELYRAGGGSMMEAEGVGECLDRVVIPVVSDGQDGEKGDPGADGKDGKDGRQGIQGCVYRRSRWEAGKEFRNDKELTTEDIRYIDCVYILPPGSAAIASRAKWFRCRKTHTSTDACSPQLTSNGTEPWLEFWEPLNSLEPTYTPFLMADDAVIRFMQSNEILITDANDCVEAGVSGSDEGGAIRFWAGSQLPADAPFRVDREGNLVASRAVINGTVVAKSGQIGALRIVGNSLIGFRDGEQCVEISVGELPATGDAFQTVGLDYEAFDSSGRRLETEFVREEGVYWMKTVSKSFDLDCGNSVCTPKVFLPASVAFSLKSAPGKLILSRLSVNVSDVTADFGVKVGCTVQADLYLVKNGVRKKILPSTIADYGSLIYDYEYNNLEAGDYEADLLASAENISIGSGRYAYGTLNLNFGGILASMSMTDADARKGALTMMAKDGMIIIRDSTHYTRMSGTDGFETRFGNYGLRVGANGLQRLNSSGAWVSF